MSLSLSTPINDPVPEFSLSISYIYVRAQGIINRKVDREITQENGFIICLAFHSLFIILFIL